MFFDIHKPISSAEKDLDKKLYPNYTTKLSMATYFSQRRLQMESNAHVMYDMQKGRPASPAQESLFVMGDKRQSMSCQMFGGISEMPSSINETIGYPYSFNLAVIDNQATEIWFKDRCYWPEKIWKDSLISNKVSNTL